MRNIQQQVFLFQNSLKRTSRASFAPFSSVENRNSENTTNMSFGSNGADWACSLRKIQMQVFFFRKSLKRPSRASFATLYHRKPKLRKRNKHEFWVKRGALCAFIAENSTASFFVPNAAKTDLPDEFRTVLPSKTETLKTQQT
jgi:hypothetical protein